MKWYSPACNNGDTISIWCHYDAQCKDVSHRIKKTVLCESSMHKENSVKDRSKLEYL